MKELVVSKFYTMLCFLFLFLCNHSFIVDQLPNFLELFLVQSFHLVSTQLKLGFLPPVLQTFLPECLGSLILFPVLGRSSYPVKSKASRRPSRFPSQFSHFIDSTYLVRIFCLFLHPSYWIVSLSGQFVFPIYLS